MVEPSQGAGSIWNKNSWHWEERNYTDMAKKILNEHLVNVKLDVPEVPAVITLYEVKKIEGQASITIRKQKQIFLFEFELEMYFKAQHSEQSETNTMGTIKIHEFN